MGRGSLAMDIEHSEIIANCEQHGTYPATISIFTTGDNTRRSTPSCPQCMKQLRERRRRGLDETQNTVICERHGEYTATTKTYFESACTYTSSCPSCEKEREEQREGHRRKQDQELQQEQRCARIDRNRRAAAIPTRFACCTFDGYVATVEGQRRAHVAAKGFAETFDAVSQTGSSLLLSGKPGCGKTHLACAIANNLLDAGRTVIYTQVVELIRAIRDTWRRDSDRSETAVIEKYRSADLLILDEVGVQFGSEAERTQLFDILDGRYRERRPTVIVSNLSGNALRGCLGERLFDRMTEVGSHVVLFDWGSYRREE